MFSCPDDWEEYDGHCYLVVVECLIWTEAENECTLHGGHLASIHSQEEQDFIYNLTAEYWDGTPFPPLYWIGGSKYEPEVMMSYTLHYSHPPFTEI